MKKVVYSEIFEKAQKTLFPVQDDTNVSAAFSHELGFYWFICLME